MFSGTAPISLSKALYVLKIDSKAAGGERALGGPYLSPTASSYKAAGT